MNRLSRILICLAATATLAHGAGTNFPGIDVNNLFFRNGDFLDGNLAGIDGNTLRWQRPDTIEAMEFATDAISQIDFPDRTNSAPHTDNACRLFLNDGNTLEGDLASCDRQSLKLQTWYAGQLTIPRSALKSLVFLPRSPALVDGIRGLDGWTQATSAAAGLNETGRWIYRNGAFYADKAASIARDVKLPDVAEIQFDLNWKGGLNLAVALYTDSLVPILLTAKEQGPNFGGFYSLRFQYSAFIDLWPIKKMEPLHPLGQLYVPALNTSDRLHVDLRVSKPQHKVALLLDGKLAKEWVDPDGFAGEGTGVRFVQNPPGIIKLTNLRIAKWDGNFSATNELPPDTKQDIVWPDSGVKVVGTIDSIADGKVTVTTPAAPVQLPLATVDTIDFAHGPGAAPALLPNTVRASFPAGGAVTVVLDSWRPDKMTVHSPDFGKIEINPAAVTRLQFLAPKKEPAEGPKG